MRPVSDPSRRVIILHTAFGVLFGLCFPIVSLSLDAFLLRDKPAAVLEMMRENPVQCVVALAPIVLGGVFTIVGRMRWQLQKRMMDLNAAMERAMESDHAKSAFLATVSHEVRTPLNGVLGMAQLLLSDHLSSAQKARVATIVDSGEQLLSVLDDVLDFAKIEAGRMDIEHIEFDLEDVVERVRNLFSGKAFEHDLDITATTSRDAAGRYCGDPTRIAQILGNLVSNALKFTEEGGVEVRAEREREDVVFSVTDTGPGISAELASRLFQPFMQADRSWARKFGGTGLGLAICWRLAKAMGGSVTLASAPDEGATFVVRLPLKRVSPANLAAERHAATISTPHLGSVRVLAAEDNAVNRAVLEGMLEALHIGFRIVENGAEAVEAWRAEDWTAILLDVQMPVMDGFGACAAIRAEERLNDRDPVPIIALTANAMTHQRREYAAAGIDGFVAKPIQLKALAAELSRVIAHTKPGQGEKRSTAAA